MTLRSTRVLASGPRCADTSRMRLAFRLATILAFAYTGCAVAQDTPATPPAGPKITPPGPATLSAAMEATLRKAGFTELQILPNSVLVRGKDKAGQPVAMVLNPATMTEVVTLDPHSGTAAGGDGTPLTGSATFVTALPSETLASRLIGTPLLGHTGETLGTIRDLAVDHGGIRAYVIRIGGVLGIGARYAAVTPAAIALRFDGTVRRYKATMDATPEQMKAAPDFKYEAVDDAAR